MSDTLCNTAGTGAPPPRRRIERVDALRGFALMGIVQVNIQSFTWGAGEPLAYLANPPAPADALLYFLQAAFIEGKFYPIFAFLFGVGMALQVRKLRRLHAPGAAAAYRRRLFILFAIGLAHGLLLFSGDVIATYAVCGLLLAPFAGERLGRLQRLGGALWILAALSLVLPMGLAALGEASATPEAIPAAVLQAHDIYTRGGYGAELAQRAYDELWQQVGDIPTFWPQVLALFTLGVIAGRLGWLQQPQRHPQVWHRARQLGLYLGLPLSLAGAALSVARLHVLPGSDAGWDAVVLGLGSLLAAGYVAAALHVFDARWGAPLCRWFAAAGRLSLTNYVGQSLAMALLLSGWGLGLGAVASRGQLALLAAAIFAVQLLASRAILLRYRQGPLEAIWRRATYGRPRTAAGQS